MFYFSEDHLRVTKVRTADGQSPMLGEDEKPLKKIVFFPDNKANRKLLEEQNSRLPTSLKMKIDPVKAYKPTAIEPVVSPDVSALEAKIKELQEQNAELQKKNTENLSNGVSENGKSLNETKSVTSKNAEHEKK